MAKNLIEKAKESKEVLRARRARAFKAFDIFKTNKAVQIVEVSDKRWKDIVKWYNDCLNLDKEAINNIPEEISRYL